MATFVDAGPNVLGFVCFGHSMCMMKSREDSLWQESTPNRKHLKERASAKRNSFWGRRAWWWTRRRSSVCHAFSLTKSSVWKNSKTRKSKLFLFSTDSFLFCLIVFFFASVNGGSEETKVGLREREREREREKERERGGVC